MQSLILTLHIIVCVLLVILVLLQSGKEGMGVIFGGGNTSVFGSSGAGGILAKLTTLMAIIFIITSLSYTYVSSSRAPKESMILDVQIEKPAAEAMKPAETPKEPAPAVAPAGSAKESAPVAAEPANNPVPPVTPAEDSKADVGVPSQDKADTPAKPQAQQGGAASQSR